MTAPVIVTRVGKGSPLTYEEVDANFVNLRDAADASSFDRISGDLTVSAGGVAAIGAGAIVDGDVNANAQIAHSKLAPVAAGSLIMGDAANTPTATAITGDITVSSTGVVAIATEVIVDDDISATAEIAHSKLAPVAAGSLIMGDAANTPTATAITGDITVSSTGVVAIAAGAIVNADISATAEIAVSKLANGTARQLLQTAASGTDVEWATDIDIPGTLDVAGVATFDSAVNCGVLQHPSAASPAIELAADGTAAVTVSGINGGPLTGFRNAIINGNFDVWQRGTSFSSSAYGADRWRFIVTGSTATLSRQSFTLGQTDVPGEPTYFTRVAVTSAAGAANRVLINQSIEGVRTFAGQTVTLSFYAKADAAKNISFKFYQQFGTGGSPSSTVDNINVNKVSIGTSWQLITSTFTVPSISSKTLGSGGNDALAFEIYFDAGSDWDAATDSLGHQSGTFDISKVQLELGPVATPFECRPIGTEYTLCQRYYHKIRQNLFSSGNASIARIHVFYPTSMRATPTITFTTATGGALDWACSEFAQFYRGGTPVSIELTSATFDAEL